MVGRVGGRSGYQVQYERGWENGNSGDKRIQIEPTNCLFGEKILYMPLKISTKPVPKMEERFREGIFLGMRMRSDEIIVGTADGVIKARTIRRRPKGEQWSAEEVKNMKGTPSMPVPGVQSDNITSRVGREAEDDEEGRPQVEEEPNEDGDVQKEPVT